MTDQTTDQPFMEELHALLREGEEDALRIFLRLVRPEDIADWLDQLTADERQRVLSNLDHDAAGTVLADTTASIRAALVDEIEPERLARIAEAMPADEAADLIGELTEPDSEQVLHHIDDANEEVLRQLLEFPEDTAGGIMNPDVVAMDPSATVDDAIRHLREASADTFVAALYVVDSERTLIGFVRLRRLVTAHPAAQLEPVSEALDVGVRQRRETEVG